MSTERIALNVLWLTPALVRLGLVLFMLHQRLYHEFPAFFSYLTYHVLKTAALVLLIDRSPWGYFYTFWIGEALGFVLVFAVIYEIMRHVLRPYDALWDVGRKLFFGVAGLLLVLAVVSAADTTAGADHNALMAWIYATGRSLRIVQCGLLGFLLLFSTYFGITWRHRVFGIALGLGLYASVELAATAVRSEVGWIGDDIYRQVRMVLSSCSVLIWAAYLLKPEPARVAVGRVPQTQVEQWNQALQEMWPR
ncbi:MAG: hypothetical protein ACRD2Q_02785 [Terriglobales bacterium]